MPTAVQAEEKVFMHGERRNYTVEEFDELVEDLTTAYANENWDEFSRIGRTVPFHPVVAKAIKEVYGKEALLARGYDLTEANLKFGEGWLDEPSGR